MGVDRQRIDEVAAPHATRWIRRGGAGRMPYVAGPAWGRSDAADTKLSEITMMKRGPDPRRVIDVGNMSPEDAAMLHEALRLTILECEREIQQAAIRDAEDPAADPQD